MVRVTANAARLLAFCDQQGGRLTTPRHFETGRTARRRTIAALLTALLVVGTLVIGATTTLAAPPDAAAAAAYLAAHLGGRPDDFTLVYQRAGIPAPDGSGAVMWAGKFRDRRTGRIELVYRVAGDTGGVELPRGREHAAQAGLSALERKATPALLHALSEPGAAPDRSLPIAVWVAADTRPAEAAVAARHPEVTWRGGRPIVSSLSQARALGAELWAARQDVYIAAASGLRGAVPGLGGAIGYASTSAPLVFVDLPASAVAALAKRNDIVALGLEGGWSQAMSSAGPTVDADWTTGTGDAGTGIRVGVVEYDNVHNSGDLAGKVVASYSTTGTLAYASGFDHPTWVAGAVAGQSATYRGIAPGAVIVSAGTGGYPGPSVSLDRAVIGAADWAISPSGGAVDLVNTSLGQDTATGAEDARRYFDAIVAENSRLAVSAAGNYTTFNNWNVVSPGTGWNVLTVGGIDDKQTTSRTDDRVWYVPGSNGSNWIDPSGTAWNPDGDFNKPNLVAPSVQVRTANGLSASGTSVATPIVAGVAAQLLANEPELNLWPEGTRAVLMASAIYTVLMPDGSVQPDHSGVGMTSALWANRIAVAGDGTYGGYRLDSLVKDQALVQQIAVTAGDRVRVALAWDSHTSGGNLNKTDVLQADLDLRVTAPGGSVAGSYTLDNANEFVELVAPSSGTMTIEVLQTRFDGTSERVGLAWAKVPGPPAPTPTPTPSPTPTPTPSPTPTPTPTATAVVTPDFSLSASPASRTVKQGVGTTYAISIARTNLTDAVTLTVTGLPAGTTGTFSPDPTADSASTLTLTTSKSGTITPTGNYPLTVTGIAGSVTRTVPLTLVVTDGVAPTVVAPTYRIPYPATLGSTTVSVTVAWSASDPSGLGSYQLQRQVNGGSWAAVSLASATSTSITQSLTRGTTYRYRVLASDRAGNASGLVQGRAFQALLAEQTSAAVAYTGHWIPITASGASGGTMVQASAANASATFTFTGSAVSWVTYLGPNDGSAKLYVDGVYKATVSNYSTSYVPKRINFAASWSTAGTHTLKVVVVGTAGHPKVDIDAFVWLKLI